MKLIYTLDYSLYYSRRIDYFLGNQQKAKILMENHISNRLKNFDSSIFREVFRKQQLLDHPIDLSVGIPEDYTPSHIKHAGIRAIEQNLTSYTPANGLPELRESIAVKLSTKNGVETDAAQVTIVPGLTTGLLLVYLAILDPGDEIIVMDPCYPPYQHLATAIGAQVLTVLTLPTFHPDIPAIEASITHRTKAIVLNTPNNPTGAVYTPQELLSIAAIAEKHDLLIIADEIYENFVYEGAHFSIGSVYPNTLTMNGFSKEYSMTGWRLGYITGPVQLIDAINELQQYIVFSSSSIAQHAALEALKHPPAVRDRYLRKRNLVLSKLTGAGYSLHGAQGSYYAFFQAPHDMTDLEFVERAAEHNVLLVPGRAFSSRHGYVRLSYGADYDTVERGLEVIVNLTTVV